MFVLGLGHLKGWVKLENAGTWLACDNFLFKIPCSADKLGWKWSWSPWGGSRWMNELCGLLKYRLTREVRTSSGSSLLYHHVTTPKGRAIASPFFIAITFSSCSRRTKWVTLAMYKSFQKLTTKKSVAAGIRAQVPTATTWDSNH